MQHQPARADRRNRSTALAGLAASCALVLSCLCPSVARATEPRAGTRSATLAVSATVLRTCTVTTPALLVVADGATAESSIAAVGEQVSLDCSQGDPASVRVGAPEAGSAALAELAKQVDAAAYAASTAEVSEPVVVTVLF